MHLGSPISRGFQIVTQLSGQLSDKTLILRTNIVQEVKDIASGETHLTIVVSQTVQELRSMLEKSP
jgi:hypothetical protein